MIGVLRLCFWAAALYLFFLLAFPEVPKSPYFPAMGGALLLGAAGLATALKMIRLTLLVTLAFELAFVTAAALLLGYTMPQTCGSPPIVQWAQGYRPRRSQAAQGARRLGLDPRAGAGIALVNLFPKD